MLKTQKQTQKVDRNSAWQSNMDNLYRQDIEATNAAVAAIAGLSREDLEEKYSKY